MGGVMTNLAVVRLQLLRHAIMAGFTLNGTPYAMDVEQHPLTTRAFYTFSSKKLVQITILKLEDIRLQNLIEEPRVDSAVKHTLPFTIAM
jgi:hypothetical protein